MSDKLNDDAELAMMADLLGKGATIHGIELRPLTLASMALLFQIDSDLIKGLKFEECENLLLDCCKFLALQSMSLKDAVKISRNRDALDLKAMEIAESLPAYAFSDVIEAVTQLMADAQKNRVELSEENNEDVMKGPDDNDEPADPVGEA